MKPGWKTSEFWLTKLAMVLGAAMVIAPLFLPGDHWAIQVAGAILAALSSHGYSSSRGKVKAAEAFAKANTGGSSPI